MRTLALRGSARVAVVTAAHSSGRSGWVHTDTGCSERERLRYEQPMGKQGQSVGAERTWAAAWMRLVTPSLRRILDTCTLAVFSLM